ATGPISLHSTEDYTFVIRGWYPARRPARWPTDPFPHAGGVTPATGRKGRCRDAHHPPHGGTAASRGDQAPPVADLRPRGRRRRHRHPEERRAHQHARADG